MKFSATSGDQISIMAVRAQVTQTNQQKLSFGDWNPRQMRPLCAYSDTVTERTTFFSCNTTFISGFCYK